MFTYTAGTLFFLAFWGLLFALVPKSRKPILWSSFAWGHLGPLGQYWHLKDYWSPEYMLTIKIADWSFGIEDYIFAFSFAGLCTAVFDVIIRKFGQKELAKFNAVGYILLVFLALTCFAVMSVFVSLLNLNSLYAATFTFLIGSLVVFAVRPNWIRAALLTTFIMAFFFWFFYWAFYFRLFPGLLGQWWKSDAVSGISLGGVPIEEVIWAWATALFIGPALRYFMDRRGTSL